MTAKGIGGYFELELQNKGKFLHDDGVLLNSGRNALEYVLRALGDVKELLVPYYTCDVIMEPIEKLGVSYKFYPINRKLEIEDLPTLKSGEYLIYTNYFGIKDEYVRTLAADYGCQLIVDNAQAWYAEPVKGINTIYSPRKYVGIPDGGVAYCPKAKNMSAFEQDLSFERCSHLLKRIDIGSSEGYADFKANSKQLVGQPVKRMSKLTERMLSSINFEVVKKRRVENFEYLHSLLEKKNRFDMPSMDSFACPMVYPYLTKDDTLRKKLIENKVFVATYWPNVKEWTTSGMLEYELMDKLIPVPVDQRYGVGEMNEIINIIIK